MNEGYTKPQIVSEYFRMKRKYIILAFGGILMLCIMLIACTNNLASEQTKINIVIPGTKTSDFNLIEYQNQIESEFNILYFGLKKAKIHIDYFAPISQNDIKKHVNETQNFTHPNILYLLRRNLDKPEANDLKITIDSNITYPIILNRSSTNSFNWRTKDTVIANPVIIENISTNFIEITYDNKVPIELQAKDRNDNWQNLTYPYQWFCGTGLYAHPIFPGEIVITSIPKFDGEFATYGRIKIHKYISEQFPINLNEKIFINPFED